MKLRNQMKIQNAVDISFYSIYVILGLQNYEIKDSMWCKSCIRVASKCKEYKSAFQAKAECNEDVNCTMFYDIRGWKRFRLCGLSSITKPSQKGSILYIKQPGK